MRPGEPTPTMIIPSGADIQVDAHGQLSISTPGNLVIQHSGHYATLESQNGSIRIEPEAEVEAVNIKCAQTCFIQGSLTAWKVVAQSIHLEDSAQANIVLQETDRLEIGQNARLVGNFKSEKELFYLFSRFAGELRALPVFSERKKVGAGDDGRDAEVDDVPAYLLAEAVTAAADDGGAEAPGPAGEAPASAPPPAAGPGTPLPDPLFFSLVILEREFTRPAYGPSSQRAIEEIVKLLRSRDLETLRLTYRTLFGRIVEPGKDVERVLELVDQYFRQPGA